MDYAGANRAYTESSVLTAPPERLVVMLYDGAIRFLKQAAVADARRPDRMLRSTACAAPRRSSTS